jgi:hypothetical protein
MWLLLPMQHLCHYYVLCFDQVLTSSLDGTLRQWDIQEGSCLASWPAGEPIESMVSSTTAAAAAVPQQQQQQQQQCHSSSSSSSSSYGVLAPAATVDQLESVPLTSSAGTAGQHQQPEPSVVFPSPFQAAPNGGGGGGRGLLLTCRRPLKNLLMALISAAYSTH